MITSLLTALVVFPSLQVEPKVSVSVKPAGKFMTGSMVVELPEGWHAYQNPPKSEYENPLMLKLNTKKLRLSNVNYPKGIEVMDTLAYEGKVTVPFSIIPEKGYKPTAKGHKLDFEVSYQICNDATCMPPASKKISILVKASK